LQGGGVIHAVDRRGKKKWKMIKSQGGGICLIVCIYIQVEQIGLLVAKSLVGKFLGRRVSIVCLNEWIRLEWDPIMGYGLIFHKRLD
jgi:hypothetical protein